ncbi:MAG: hypothetical protein ABIK28_01800, partial [Planctomycetota bacterium]
AFLKEGADDEAFVAALVAMEGNEPVWLKEMIHAMASDNASVAKGLGEALALTSWPGITGMLLELSKDNDPRTGSLALEALLHRRIDPGPVLDDAIDNPGHPAFVSSLRGAGLFRKRHLINKVEHYIHADDSTVAATALKSLMRLDPGKGRWACLEMLNSPAPCARAALLLGVTGQKEDLNVLAHAFFSENRTLAREALLAAGNVGHIAAVPSLIRGLGFSDLGGVACVALQRIFCDALPVEEFLLRSGPETMGHPEEDEDEIWNPDDDLPCFDPRKVQGWWDEQKMHYFVDYRYRNGEPFKPAKPRLSSPIAFMELEAIEEAIRDWFAPS